MPALLKDVAFDSDEIAVKLCGPPIMLKLNIMVLPELCSTKERTDISLNGA